jgi:fructose-1,6-bisphosphatase/inositol monophosphatase family enzyme
VSDLLIDDVGDLLREAAEKVVLPLFRQLDESDISEKAPGEVVTVADQRAEEIIGTGLRRLLPGSVVVGEEAVADDPGLLDHLGERGDVWLVDPVDGTANFAAGRHPFAMMVALLREGALTGAWILDPSGAELATAWAGQGTRLGERPVRTAVGAPSAGELRGAAMSQFLPRRQRESVEAGGRSVGELLPGLHCAGREYLDLLTGAQQFVLFWRTLPWDHAPGALLVREAGGVARRFDGTDYHPADDASGLLVAASDEIWWAVHDALLAE